MPARHKPGFDCPHCGIYSAQRWDALGTFQHVDHNEWFEVLEEHPHQLHNVFDAPQPDLTAPVVPWTVLDIWAASRCGACQKVAVWRNETVVYPVSSRIKPAHQDMPASARELYDEAASVMTVSRRAGAAMARATLERLLIELDPDAPSGSALDDRILRIETRVSSSLNDVLTVIRHGGNKAVHPRGESDGVLVLLLDKDDEAIIDVIFSAINDLVDELITKPQRRSQLLAAVPAGVLDALDRKRNRASPTTSS